MKKPLALALLCGFAVLAHAEVPGIITYQGRVAAQGTNFTGTGQFKFALLNGDNSQSLWSNNGSSANGSEPTVSVSVPVTNGLFTVALGDTNLAGMSNTIPASVFDNTNVRLRIWFNDGASGFAQLSPDQRLTSAGYALRAANVVEGAITGAQIAPGAITGTNVAGNSLTSSDIADILTLHTLNLGGVNWDGTLNLFAKPAGGGGIIGPNGEPRGIMAGDEFGSELALFFSDGETGANLASRSTGGRLQLRDAAGNDTTVDLSAGGGSGGFLTLRNPSGLTRAFLQGGGAHDGGELQLRDSTGVNRLRLYGNAPGLIIDTPSAGGVDLFDLNGNRRIAMRGVDGTIHLPQENGDEGVFLAGRALGGNGGIVRVRQGNGGLGAVLAGQDGTGGSLFTMYNGLGDATVSLDADASGRGSAFSMRNGTNVATVFLDGNSGGAGLVEVNDTDGTATIRIIGAQTGTGGGRIEMTQGNGAQTVILDGEVGTGGGGYLQLRNGTGTGTITLNSDFSGEGRITTQVLEITGGADLSEHFEIQSPQTAPGMIVCIDPERPGELTVSTRAYDRTVAGVVSGAGGVKPGLLLRQEGTRASGRHPVALTGRVYCLVDAGQGAIAPGDLVTTSATPGHGMKVRDHARAQGAIIGKAMTALNEGRGLVLVLVSLQ